MPANALVQTRIDPAVKERAAAVLGELGITVSDAVRILLTRTANEGALPFALVANAAEHDAWFRAKVKPWMIHAPLFPISGLMRTLPGAAPRPSARNRDS